ncbi:hypothetical protein Kpho02_25390 [Kitasatospora phosalacinea]|uniref:Uncharacterized protein n=1 Tax=Kitasatospora phosalacinea TaxID=2065 RepID=A0A9W6Q5D6_9ACTN|nr:hypothetical protein Kpho02_25390 [Kitasatospora phosalacinea]
MDRHRAGADAVRAVQPHLPGAAVDPTPGLPVERGEQVPAVGEVPGGGGQQPRHRAHRARGAVGQATRPGGRRPGPFRVVAHPLDQQPGQPLPLLPPTGAAICRPVTRWARFPTDSQAHFPASPAVAEPTAPSTPVTAAADSGSPPPHPQNRARSATAARMRHLTSPTVACPPRSVSTLPALGPSPPAPG